MLSHNLIPAAYQNVKYLQGLDTIPATPAQSNAISCCRPATNASNPFEYKAPLLFFAPGLTDTNRRMSKAAEI